MSENMLGALLNVSTDQLLWHHQILAFKCFAFLNWIKLPNISSFKMILYCIAQTLKGESSQFSITDEVPIPHNSEDQVQYVNENRLPQVEDDHQPPQIYDSQLPQANDNQTCNTLLNQNPNIGEYQKSFTDEDRISSTDLDSISTTDEDLMTDSDEGKMPQTNNYLPYVYQQLTNENHLQLNIVDMIHFVHGTDAILHLINGTNANPPLTYGVTAHLSLYNEENAPQHLANGENAHQHLFNGENAHQHPVNGGNAHQQFVNGENALQHPVNGENAHQQFFSGANAHHPISNAENPAQHLISGPNANHSLVAFYVVNFHNLLVNTLNPHQPLVNVANGNHPLGNGHNSYDVNAHQQHVNGGNANHPLHNEAYAYQNLIDGQSTYNYLAYGSDNKHYIVFSTNPYLVYGAVNAQFLSDESNLYYIPFTPLNFHHPYEAHNHDPNDSHIEEMNHPIYEDALVEQQINEAVMQNINPLVNQENINQEILQQAFQDNEVINHFIEQQANEAVTNPSVEQQANEAVTNPHVEQQANEAVTNSRVEQQANEIVIPNIDSPTSRTDVLGDLDLSLLWMLGIFWVLGGEFLHKCWAFSIYLVLLFMQHQGVNDVFLYGFCLLTCCLCDGMELIVDLYLFREYFFIIMRSHRSPLASLAVSILAWSIIPIESLFLIFYSVYILTILKMPLRFYLTFSYILASFQILILYKSIELPTTASSLEVLHNAIKLFLNSFFCSLNSSSSFNYQC